MEKNNLSGVTVTSELLKKELERAKGKSKSGGIFMGIILTVIFIAALFSILTTLFFPIMSVNGNSMSPNIEDGTLAVAVKTDKLERGDICVFYSGNSVLCKRVIAFGGEVVYIDGNGMVYIDNVPLDEPYLTAADFGNTDIEFPYVVPDYTYFVMGDNRAVSIDSRNSEIGCVSEGQIIGKLIFRFWPFDEMGVIE